MPPGEPAPADARFVFSPFYEVDIGAHVFPTRKYRLIVERLHAEYGVTRQQMVEPSPATEEDLLRVHERAWYERCRDGRLAPEQILRLELPWSESLFEASIRCVQGSILAAGHALDRGVGLHVGGGFHHAYPDHGEGFCVFNDHSVALRWAQAERGLRRAAVADTDLHHGNGTAAVFRDDPTVATFSIHQDGIYPLDRPPSTVDVGLPPGCSGATYLERLEEAIGPFLERAEPELVAYVAGADPYRDDQLGSLGLDLGDLRRRDEIVTAACARRGVPLFVVLAGGYARRVEDTVTIHAETIRVAWEAAG